MYMGDFDLPIVLLSKLRSMPNACKYLTKIDVLVCSRGGLERRAGIEPASLAWKAKVLPLHKRRISMLI